MENHPLWSTAGLETMSSGVVLTIRSPQKTRCHLRSDANTHQLTGELLLSFSIN